MNQSLEEGKKPKLRKNDSQEKYRRFEEKWPDILEKGDPFYNKNLTLKRGDCSLRKRNE